MAQKYPVRLLQPGLHIVQDALEFEGLAPAEGAGTIRLLLSRNAATTLVVPLSAKALSDLERQLSLLRGKLPEEMASGIASLENEGKLVLRKI